MEIITQENGNLVMYADNLEKDWIKAILKDIKKRKLNIQEFLVPKGFKQVQPEDVGCLTSAPIILKDEDIWGYMDYAIFNFMEEMLDGQETMWTKG